MFGAITRFQTRHRRLPFVVADVVDETGAPMPAGWEDAIRIPSLTAI